MRVTAYSAKIDAELLVAEDKPGGLGRDRDRLTSVEIDRVSIDADCTDAGGDKLECCHKSWHRCRSS